MWLDIYHIGMSNKEKEEPFLVHFELLFIYLFSITYVCLLNYCKRSVSVSSHTPPPPKKKKKPILMVLRFCLIILIIKYTVSCHALFASILTCGLLFSRDGPQADHWFNLQNKWQFLLIETSRSKLRKLVLK